MTVYYVIRGKRTGNWLVELDDRPALFEPSEWLAPTEKPQGFGWDWFKSGVPPNDDRPWLGSSGGRLLFASPVWLTDLEARCVVAAAECRAWRRDRRRAQQERLAARRPRPASEKGDG